jgi:hypothetical protein
MNCFLLEFKCLFVDTVDQQMLEKFVGMDWPMSTAIVGSAICAGRT